MCIHVYILYFTSIEIVTIKFDFELQGIEKSFFRFERQTVEIAAGPEPNATDRVRVSARRSDHIADDEGRAGLSRLAGRIVQTVRKVVDHAVVGGRTQNATVGVRQGHVLSKRFVAKTVQPPRQSDKLYRS